MPKAKISKKERLEQLRLEQDEWLKSKGYKGGKSLKGKHGRRIGINAVPNLRSGLGDMPPTSDTICSNGSKREAQKYTGERQLLGIATMHKSNMVPIFADKKEDAKEISQMGR